MQITSEEKERLRDLMSKLSTKSYIKKVLGNTLETFQEKITDTVDDNERTAIRACHDLGKTFVMARVAVAYLTKHRRAKVITTAPTFNQVKNILWTELRQAVEGSRIPLGGKLNQTEWELATNWYAMGYAPRNEAGSLSDGESTQSTFQGFHAPHLMVIFDEATGIPANIWTMVEGLMTSANVKLVAIGNPTSSASEFYRCFKKRDWAKIHLSCFDSPNLIANKITDIEVLKKHIEKYKSLNDADAMEYLKTYKIVRGHLLTAKWVVSKAAEWGIDHPLTQSKILGIFPKTGTNTLASLGDVEDAQMRGYTPVVSDRKILGIDVARFGTDNSIFTGLHGLKQTMWKAYSKFDEVEIAGEAINFNNNKNYGPFDVIVVDETGLGGGVVTLLRHAVANGTLPKTTEIRGIQFGENKSMSDEERKKYYNQKARIIGYLQNDLKNPKGLALLPESIYQEELPTIKYRYNEKGQMVVESKDDYKKRTGRPSPDSTDSLGLANLGRYDEISAAGSFSESANTKRPKTLAGGFKTKRNW